MVVGRDGVVQGGRQHRYWYKWSCDDIGTREAMALQRSCGVEDVDRRRCGINDAGSTTPVKRGGQDVVGLRCGIGDIGRRRQGCDDMDEGDDDDEVVGPSTWVTTCDRRRGSTTGDEDDGDEEGVVLLRRQINREGRGGRERRDERKTVRADLMLLFNLFTLGLPVPMLKHRLPFGWVVVVVQGRHRGWFYKDVVDVVQGEGVDSGAEEVEATRLG
jgi:hypothetical protein